MSSVLLCFCSNFKVLYRNDSMNLDRRLRKYQVLLHKLVVPQITRVAVAGREYKLPYFVKQKRVVEISEGRLKGIAASLAVRGSLSLNRGVPVIQTVREVGCSGRLVEFLHLFGGILDNAQRASVIHASETIVLKWKVVGDNARMVAGLLTSVKSSRQHVFEVLASDADLELTKAEKRLLDATSMQRNAVQGEWLDCWEQAAAVFDAHCNIERSELVMSTDKAILEAFQRFLRSQDMAFGEIKKEMWNGKMIHRWRLRDGEALLTKLCPLLCEKKEQVSNHLQLSGMDDADTILRRKLNTERRRRMKLGEDAPSEMEVALLQRMQEVHEEKKMAECRDRLLRSREMIRDALRRGAYLRPP